MPTQFFTPRPKITPTIYVYSLPEVSSHKGYIKIGYTNRTAEQRIKEQTHTSGLKVQILLQESAMRPEGL